MNKEKIKESIKKIFFNKNTVTLILVLILIVIVYFVYSSMIEKATEPVTLNYATELIKSNEVIKREQIGSIRVPGTFLQTNGENIIQNYGRILNYQVKSGYQIPANSFFYTDAVVEQNPSATDVFYDIPDGYTIYPLKVDFKKTYGNSIMPGNYIDLYFKASGEEGKLIFEKFVTSIKVYRVLDSSFYDVFSRGDEEEEAKPAYLYFAVRDDVFKLLNICEKIDAEIIPIPRNAGYSENPAEMEIANPAVEEFIKVREYDMSK